MKNLTLLQKQWIYSISCLLISAYLAMDFFSSDFSNYQSKEVDLSSLIQIKKKELGRIIQENQRKDSLEFEIKKASREFLALQEMFPDRDIIPKRLTDLYKASRRSAVIPISFKPIHTQEKEFYNENLYEVTLNSSYHELGKFFEELANLTYPTALTQMSISQNPRVLLDSSKTYDTEGIQTTLTRFILKTFTAK